MKTIKGTRIFLAQLIGVAPPFDSLDGLACWAAGLGYVGLQLPTTAGCRASAGCRLYNQ